MPLMSCLSLARDVSSSLFVDCHVGLNRGEDDERMRRGAADIVGLAMTPLAGRTSMGLRTSGPPASDASSVGDTWGVERPSSAVDRRRDARFAVGSGLVRRSREVPVLDGVDHACVGEGGGVPQLLVLGDVAQKPTHNLP